jgi:hypothetical protein
MSQYFHLRKMKMVMSDEDGQLDENCETNEDGGTRTSGQKLLI